MCDDSSPHYSTVHSQSYTICAAVLNGIICVLHIVSIGGQMAHMAVHWLKRTLVRVINNKSVCLSLFLLGHYHTSGKKCIHCITGANPQSLCSGLANLTV